MCSHFSSEASFARQWTMQVLQTLQTGTSVLFFSGCVCTLGPPVLPSLEEMDHSRLEPKESGTTICPSPAHCRGNPGRDGCQHHPQPRPAHRTIRQASRRGSSPPSRCFRGRAADFRMGSDLPRVVSSELGFVTSKATLCCLDTGPH